jgi:hypothetical protein
MTTMSTVVDTAVQQSRNLSKEKLKKAVEEAVHKDDRAKNVVVFGLPEEKSKDLDGKINELF